MKIERDIPMPQKRQRTSYYEWPDWDAFTVGDSVFFDYDREIMRNKVAQLIAAYRDKEWHFIMRKFNTGFRVWRDR